MKLLTYTGDAPQSFINIQPITFSIQPCQQRLFNTDHDPSVDFLPKTERHGLHAWIVLGISATTFGRSWAGDVLAGCGGMKTTLLYSGECEFAEAGQEGITSFNQIKDATGLRA